MTSLKEAISITENFLQERDAYKGYIIDNEGVLEKEFLWYVPFKSSGSNQEKLIGAYSGLIVDKNSEEYFQPGSAFSLEKWMYGFRIGLRGGRYDLQIQKINNDLKALEILEKLGMTYVKIELVGSSEYKIPQNFSRKEIKNRINKLPFLFKNQSFTFSIDDFKLIRNEKIFEYRLTETDNEDPSLMGELLAD